MKDWPKYPNVTVQLTGEDGNAFSIVGRVKKAMRTEGVPLDRIDEFQSRAMSGDYDHLLRTCMEWVNVE